METKPKKDFQELKKLDKDSLRVLASDIRADILSACLSNGGHLSSNLGTVELTLSVMKAFPPDENDILFDVGHQSYTYKIMTGRDISTIRRTNGVSPFNLREESIYDVYSNGHAGDSISTAYGIAKAKELSRDESYTIVVIGDASIENGMAFEALDQIAGKHEPKRLIIVLNDNGMAISRNNGPLSKKFDHLRNSRFYFRTSSLLGRKMSKHKFSWKVFLKLRAMKDHLKGMVLKPTIFEAMGIKYIGPYDGHDFDSLDLAFEKARIISAKQPVLVHLITKKGYGYPLAMKDEKGDFHGVSKDFDQKSYVPNQQFTSIKQSLLYGPMKQDKKIIVITPAMEKGSGLELLFREFPERCIDTGISEEHAVVLASGLALKGYHPILDIYSTFLQRTYDELIENVSRNNVPLTILVERAGIVGEDGSSHQGIYDVGMVADIPYRKVMMPFDVTSVNYLFELAKQNQKGPFFIRFPKGNPSFEVPSHEVKDGFAIFRKFNNHKLVIGISVLGYELIKQLPEEYDTLMMLDLLPEDEALNRLNLNHYDEIHLYDCYSTMDGSVRHLESYLIRHNYHGKFTGHAFDRKFVTYGQSADILKEESMDVSSVLRKIIQGEIR